VNYAARGGSFPPSGVAIDIHYPDTEADGGWAFREGWAEFFPCAVDNSTTMYGGGYGSIETTVYADNPFGHGDYRTLWDGDIVEGAVAQVFWDILDGVSPSDYPHWDEAYGDHISGEFGQLWHIFLTHKPDNIQDFWEQWTPKDAKIWAIFHHARILESRNVAVTGIVPSHESAVAGETLDINVTIENRGDTTEVFNLTASTNQLAIGQLDNIILESGNSAIFTIICNTTGMTKGDHVLSAQAILLPKDLNVTDDMKSCVITLVSSGHDVGLSNVTMSKAINGQGYILTIRMKTRNIGSYEEAFNVTLYANSTTIGTFPGILLTSGQSTILTLEWDSALVQKGNYTILVSVSMASNDTDLTDNAVQCYVFITIPGDVDGDFDVDLYDVVKLCAAYCSRPPGPPYAPGLDINEDGIVNIFDLVIACSRYGQKYP
jgi:hypothetical protein